MTRKSRKERRATLTKSQRRERFRKRECNKRGGTYKDGKCRSKNPGTIITLPRYNPAKHRMPTQAEGGLSNAEGNYPRPGGKRFPVSSKGIVRR